MKYDLIGHLKQMLDDTTTTLGKISDQTKIPKSTLQSIISNPESKPSKRNLTAIISFLLGYYPIQEVASLIPNEWNYEIPTEILKNYWGVSLRVSDEHAWWTIDLETFLIFTKIDSRHCTREDLMKPNEKKVLDKLEKQDLISEDGYGKLYVNKLITYTDRITHHRLASFGLDKSLENFEDDLNFIANFVCYTPKYYLSRFRERVEEFFRRELEYVKTHHRSENTILMTIQATQLNSKMEKNNV